MDSPSSFAVYKSLIPPRGASCSSQHLLTSSKLLVIERKVSLPHIFYAFTAAPLCMIQLSLHSQFPLESLRAFWTDEGEYFLGCMIRASITFVLSIDVEEPSANVLVQILVTMDEPRQAENRSIQNIRTQTMLPLDRAVVTLVPKSLAFVRLPWPVMAAFQAIQANMYPICCIRNSPALLCCGDAARTGCPPSGLPRETGMPIQKPLSGPVGWGLGRADTRESPTHLTARETRCFVYRSTPAGTKLEKSLIVVEYKYTVIDPSRTPLPPPTHASVASTMPCLEVARPPAHVLSPTAPKTLLASPPAT